MEIATSEDPAAAPPASGPAMRESVLGSKVTITWLVTFCFGAVACTVAVMTFIDGRMEDKLSLVRKDMDLFRMDVKEGFRDLRDEVRLLRTK